MRCKGFHVVKVADLRKGLWEFMNGKKTILKNEGEWFVGVRINEFVEH